MHRAASPSRPLVAAAGPGAARRRTRAGGSRPGHDPVPLEYFQGVTSDRTATSSSTGSSSACTAPTRELVEQARNDSAIPTDVFQREGYNHIGDITWDQREGGRVLLPLECFIPFVGNTCKTGSIGVADPDTLAVALLREARPGLHRQGDVGRGLARTASCSGRPTAPQRRQRPARLRHEGDQGGERGPRRPAAEAGARARRRRPAERHHRRRLLQGPPVPRGSGRWAVPGLVGGPDGRLAPARDREADRSASPRASTS